MFANQNLAAAPRGQGFCLPGISHEIPIALNDNHKQQRLLARLASIAEKNGLYLPMGKCESITDLLARQWSGYVARQHPNAVKNQWQARPSISLTDDHLTVEIGAEGGIEIYRLKPVIEALEAEKSGLGWFVFSAIRVSDSYGLPVYLPDQIGYQLGCHYGYDSDEFTDENYCKHLMAEEGQTSPDIITPEMISEMKEQYDHWPSDLLEDVDGHEHLLGVGYGKGAKHPLVLTDKQAKTWIASHKDHPLATVVNLAIEFKASVAKPNAKAFLWDCQDDYGEESERIGALAIVAWDSPDLLMEMIQHHEEMAYQCGYCHEALGRISIDLKTGITDEQLVQLVKHTQEYLKRMDLLTELLSQFPLWERNNGI